MIAPLLPWPRAKFFVPNTNYPLAGGKVFTYVAGTSTPLGTFTDSSGTVPNANPVILDANGEAAIYLGPNLAYKINLTDASNVQIQGYPVDNILGDDINLRANLASTVPPFGATLVGFNGHTVAQELEQLNQPATNQFFTTNGAIIQRLNDRVFIGGATVCSGDFPQTTNDWLSAFYDANGYALGYTLNGQLVVLSSESGASAEMVIGGVQSEHFVSNGAFGAGFYGIGINNNPTFASGVNAFYGEAHNLLSSSSSAYGMELDTRTLVDSSNPTPHVQGTIVGVQLGSGAGTTGAFIQASVATNQLTVSSVTFALPYGNVPQSYQIGIGSKIYGVGVPPGTVVTALGTGTGGAGTYTLNNSLTLSARSMVATDQFDASCGLQIQANPAKFKVGINIAANSIAGADGVQGTGIAIALASGHIMKWYNNTDGLAGSVSSINTNASTATGLQFNNLGAAITGESGQTIALIPNAPAAVNFPILGAGVTGSPAFAAAGGNDTDIDFQIFPKGAGSIRFGTFAAGALAVTGSISIKDAGGTVRRLLVG